MKTIFVKLTALLILLGSATLVWADPVWIDVRSPEEFAADHIDGDVNIPLAELDAAALATQYGKDAEIALYCRSGNRAGQAKDLLEAAGFTQVSNAGGIGDVRELRKIAAAASSSANAAPGTEGQ
jgi:phage shock protein E